MHEFSICESIFKTIEEEFPEEDLSSVTEIHLKIGLLSNIEPIILQQVFSIMKEEGPFSAATLFIQQTRVIAECELCRETFNVEGYKFICPNCGSSVSKIVEGQELLICKIVFEKAEEFSHEEIDQ